MIVEFLLSEKDLSVFGFEVIERFKVIYNDIGGFEK